MNLDRPCFFTSQPDILDQTINILLSLLSLHTYTSTSYYNLSAARYSSSTETSINRRHPPQMPTQHCSTTAANTQPLLSPAIHHPHLFTASSAQATAVDVHLVRNPESYIWLHSLSRWLGWRKSFSHNSSTTPSTTVDFRLPQP